MPEAHIVQGKEAPTGLYLHTSNEEVAKPSIITSTVASVSDALTLVRRVASRTVTTVRALGPNFN